MVKEIEYINIRELLSRVLRHNLLQEFTLERAIQETLDFMGLFSFPDMYEDMECEVDICNYRGQLPCGIIEINMVKDCKTDVSLRSMTAAFNPGGKYYNHLQQEPQYKTNHNRVIITSFPEGKVRVAYKGIPVDEEGLPLLINNPKYLKALELYVKCQLFTDLFDEGKITPQVLNHTEQEYCWAAGQLSEEFKTPSEAEMQTITNILHQMLPRHSEFYNGYESLGNKEFQVVH